MNNELAVEKKKRERERERERDREERKNSVPDLTF